MNHLNILIIGAHPDDAEAKAGGFAALCRQYGHKVWLLSMTNGNTGHKTMAGGELARRRAREAAAAAAVIKAESIVMDINSNELEANIFWRRRLTEIIRNIRADIVLTHRTNDYHPDHRYTALLVQDTSATLCNPNVCPLTTPLARSPAFLYFADNFRKPVPFSPDLVFAIDSVIETKLKMLAAHESQMFEWLPYESQFKDPVPSDAAARLTWLRQWRTKNDHELVNCFRSCLTAKYGNDGERIQFAEAFEFSEYGGQWLQSDVKAYGKNLDWFPF